MLRRRLPDILLTLLLAIIGYKIAHTSWMYTDIWLYDESMYLSKGLAFNPFQSYFKDGYVYFIWYKILSLFAPDPIDLYFLNNAILLVAPAIAVYIALRVFKANILISFITSLLFMISVINAVSWPVITKFALMVMLILLSMIYLIKETRSKVIAAMFSSLFMTYIRPEFILSLVLFSLIYAALIFREHGFRLERKVIKSLSIIIPVVIIIIIFNPVTGNRANLAFTQHYVKGINERRGVITSEGLTGIDSIMKADFGGNVSMREAIIRNPGKIVTHMKYNILRVDDNMGFMIPMAVSNGGNKFLNKAMLIILYAAAVLSLLLFVRRILKRKITLFSLIYFIFAMPTMVSIIFYFPRTHYIIITTVLISIFMGVELSRFIKDNIKIQKMCFALSVMIGASTLILVPLTAGEQLLHDKNCSTFNTLKEMKKFQQHRSVNLLAAGSGIHNYIGSNWNYISPEIINEPIEQFVENKNIDVILVTEYLLLHPKIKNDLAFPKLTENGRFRRVDILNCSSYLLVSAKMLENK